MCGVWLTDPAPEGTGIADVQGSLFSARDGADMPPAKDELSEGCKSLVGHLACPADELDAERGCLRFAPPRVESFRN